MLPVVRGDRETARQIVWYSIVLVGGHAAAVRLADGRRGLSRRGACCWAPAFLGSPWRLRRETTPARARRSVPLLAPVPGAAVRGRWPLDPLLWMNEPELRRKNMRLGLALFGLFVVLLGADLRGRLHLPRRLLRRARGHLPRPPGATPDEGIAASGHETSSTPPALVTTYGSILFADPRARARPPGAVQRLEAAGYAERRQSTNLHEFAYGTTSENRALRAPCRILATPGRIAGGSSGRLGGRTRGRASPTPRSAPTPAARSCIPAACCGMTGFKPTYGLVPIEGCFPLAPSFDHAGPMARDVDGCEQMLQALVLRSSRRRSTSARSRSASPDRASGPARSRQSRSGRGGALPAPAAGWSSPRADGFTTRFSREVADVHRELFAEHADSYGENIRPKIERCPRRHRCRVRAGPASGGTLPRAAGRGRGTASTWC